MCQNFMAAGVSATDLKLFTVDASGFLWTGLMMKLKMSVPVVYHMSSGLLVMSLGPAALRGFSCFRVFRTCVSATWNAVSTGLQRNFEGVSVFSLLKLA